MHNSHSFTSQMELRSLQHSSSPLTTLPTSLLFRSNLVKTQLFYGQFIKISGFRKHPCSKILQTSHIRAQLSSVTISSSKVEENTENVGSENDGNVVFVAGATGKVGSRTVRELLKLGCEVRAGVRSAQRAESLVQSVKQMKVDKDATNGRTPIEMLEIVECDLEKPDRILPALGKASVVICCIGASEKEISDVTGPYRIDYLATKNLIEAATLAKVNHFLLVTSLGTNKFGFPAAILNLFWGVLCWKRKAEEALLSSGLPYTIVRPGGMERPIDSFKETHNLTLAQEDTLFGGLVSNLQVAELLAFMAKNRDLSYCKILEVVAETTAPSTPMKDLLVKIPSKRKDLQKPKEKVANIKPLEPEPKLKPESKPKPKPEPEPEPEVAKSFISEVPIVEKEPVQEKSMVARPLSPYTMYDDLKPPSSPCPSAPTSQNTQVVRDTSEEVTVELKKSQPLSPYIAYEDLKPPTSPCPSPPGNTRDESLKSSEEVDGIPKVIDGTLSQDVQCESIFYHSPFPAYEDFKPPTSPTPSTPNTLTSSSTEPQLVNSSNTGVPEPSEEQNAGSKSRPLSPYSMYDDMKPPCSPSPSPPSRNQ